MGKLRYDEIIIEDLEVFAHHGVFEEEKREGQTFLISAKVYLDMGLSARSDDLDDTVNYGELCHFINDFISKGAHNLIEKLAKDLAEKILIHFPIEGIEIEVKKPSAPIGLPFGMVSVKTQKFWTDCYLSLGANMGDRKSYLEFAVKELGQIRGLVLGKKSKFYETPAYGKTDQADFINACLGIKTFLSPRELLEKIHEIEAEGGRIRKERWGPRTLDIDIILYGDEIIAQEDLEIPHRDMENRRFVLEPLAEIAPHAIHPLKKKKVSELLNDLEDRQVD